MHRSPDGAKLAFVSDRGDHSYIGIFSVGAAALVYLDPGYDADVSPVWTSDSATVAWRRELDTTGVDGRDVRCTRYVSTLAWALNN